MLQTHLISSKDNPKYKTILKYMAQPRLLRKDGLAVAEGAHLLYELLRWDGVAVSEIWFSQNLRKHREWPAMEDAMLDCDAGIYELEDHLYRRLSELDTSPGPLIVFTQPSEDLTDEAYEPEGEVVILDGIQDPGNLGTLIRTAAAAGVKHLWYTDDCAWPYSIKVLRAGMGGHRLVSIAPLPEDIDALLSQLTAKGYDIRATTLDEDKTLYQTDLKPKGVWIFGSEGQGVSPELLAHANVKCHIPQATDLDSLNVAGAAAVCLFEQFRQRTT